MFNYVVYSYLPEKVFIDLGNVKWNGDLIHKILGCILCPFTTDEMRVLTNSFHISYLNLDYFWYLLFYKFY